jgi:hypothetical protein
MHFDKVVALREVLGDVLCWMVLYVYDPVSYSLRRFYGQTHAYSEDRLDLVLSQKLRRGGLETTQEESCFLESSLVS